MDSMAIDHELDLGDGDLEKLESDVRQMAKKISQYRQTLPENLRHTLDSVLPTCTPIFPNLEAQVPNVLGTEEQDVGEKMNQLNERIVKNAASIPKVVKRVRDCIESINKLNSLEGTIHPAFRRRRIN